MFDVFVTGPRMGLLPARALHQRDALDQLHMDLYCPGWAAGITRFVPRARNHIVEGIPESRVTSHPEIFLMRRAQQRMRRLGVSERVLGSMRQALFRNIARQCRSEAVMGFVGTSLELFEG